VRFTWDPAKAAKNQRDHDVSFKQAVEVFHDPYARFVADLSHAGRWILFGLSNGQLFAVVHTVELHGGASDETVRLISARYATRRERRQYEEEEEEEDD
jgi:uncharacterized DUF497 family protein